MASLHKHGPTLLIVWGIWYSVFCKCGDTHPPIHIHTQTHTDRVLWVCVASWGRDVAPFVSLWFVQFSGGKLIRLNPISGGTQGVAAPLLWTCPQSLSWPPLHCLRFSLSFFAVLIRLIQNKYWDTIRQVLEPEIRWWKLGIWVKSSKEFSYKITWRNIYSWITSVTLCCFNNTEKLPV